MTTVCGRREQFGGFPLAFANYARLKGTIAKYITTVPEELTAIGIPREKILEQFEVNVFGPMDVIRAVLPVMVLSWSACVAGIALVGSFGALAAVRALFGLAQAGTYPVLSKVTRNWFPLSVRTTVQGMVASLSGRAGGACVPSAGRALETDGERKQALAWT